MAKKEKQMQQFGCAFCGGAPTLEKPPTCSECGQAMILPVFETEENQTGEG